MFLITYKYFFLKILYLFSKEKVKWDEEQFSLKNPTIRRSLYCIVSSSHLSYFQFLSLSLSIFSLIILSLLSRWFSLSLSVFCFNIISRNQFQIIFLFIYFTCIKLWRYMSHSYIYHSPLFFTYIEEVNSLYKWPIIYIGVFKIFFFSRFWNSLFKLKYFMEILF